MKTNIKIIDEIIRGLKNSKVQKGLGSIIWGAIFIEGIKQGSWLLIVAGIIAIIKIHSA